MKQVLEDFKTGECRVVEVPAPALRPGFVLVRNHYSLISSGTEGGTVKLGQMSLIGKARARPEQVRKVIQVARQQGILTAYNVAMRALEMPVALGYSCAGEVVAVGEGIDDVKPGDHVACAGPGFANHAEVVGVPRNLVVRVPQGVALRHAAFTTVGAIATQSLRVAGATLGDNVVVIGLGLLGLITAQLLRAAGCNVFGIDIDPSRIELLRARGYGKAALSGQSNLVELVQAFTRGIGADAVIITAATDDNGPVALAGELLRRKGRAVVVGRTEMTAPRETYLFKELELRTSMAYGPGTGDPSYEVEGIDYPVGYVRWTENRNMGAFLDLIQKGSLDLDALVSHEFAVDDAGNAFELISGKTGEHSAAVLIHYPLQGPGADIGPNCIRLRPDAAPTGAGRVVRYGVIGAGNFATNEFLPLLARQPDVQPRAIASATGVRARALGERYGFAACTSDSQAVIDDPESDCMFILTRHDSHADLATRALDAGKHAFVEKPLAMTSEQLDRVAKAQQRNGRLLMVGFNRRYAPLTLRLRDFFGTRGQPMSILYRANVGYRPPEHWLHNSSEGGGVILGEACHHIDFCCWLVGQPVIDIAVRTLGGAETGILPQDNVHVTLGFADGSLATVLYLSNGAKTYDAERIEVFCDNRIASLTDYKVLVLANRKRCQRQRLWFSSDKGHAGQIAALLAAIRSESAIIDVNSYLSSSRVALDVAKAVVGGLR